MVTKDDLREAIDICRREVDRELISLHEQDRENAWTEDRARELARHAAEIAVKQITDGFYASVGKKTVMIIGATVVTMVFIMKDAATRWAGFK